MIGSKRGSAEELRNEIGDRVGRGDGRARRDWHSGAVRCNIGKGINNGVGVTVCMRQPSVIALSDRADARNGGMRWHPRYPRLLSGGTGGAAECFEEQLPNPSQGSVRGQGPPGAFPIRIDTIETVGNVIGTWSRGAGGHEQRPRLSATDRINPAGSDAAGGADVVAVRVDGNKRPSEARATVVLAIDE